MTTLTEPPEVDGSGTRTRGGRARSDHRTVYLLLLPSLLPVLVFSVFPLLRGIYLGFTDAKAGRNVTISFTGLENYRELLSDSLFWSSFRIGLVWAFSVTVLQFLLALGLALLLNQRLRFRGAARVLAVVPWAMPPVVVGILWRLVYHPDAGLLNEFLHRIGADGMRTTWLGDFNTALPAVIIVGVWAGMPQTTVVLLAGLQGVPRELHEAAAVDGASAWQRFRSVTLPSLMPVIVAITSLDFIWNFNSFGLVYVLTAGGPGGKTMLPMLFAYEEAFRYGNYGYAAALGNVMVVIVVALLALYLRRRLREAN
ncbi:carbohydrate ABC transporter permease [Plantactinospora soyae]|uniref:Multiple sugar transport system permease protein n=1 Tax=Plantactinospora soyae TaxID=1544732 RepID=A0A927M3Y9_9ACTN|nr:sugar ABC transporter permease [Plantactinospora soyae]MBE1487612.1 multiple sugar transport system permease protein [Plantactinospora soyae]